MECFPLLIVAQYNFPVDCLLLSVALVLAFDRPIFNNQNINAFHAKKQNNFSIVGSEFSVKHILNT